MGLRATVHKHDENGAPTPPEAMNEDAVTRALAQLTRFWSDPYSNLGFLAHKDPNKSHPGTYARRLAVEGADD